MKIAIIGGGFFGCYISKVLHKKIGGRVHVDIYERENALISRAGVYNQCRLHLGFHYPRSPETILQTSEGFHYFKEEFADYLSFPKTNLYAVRKGGHVDLAQYLSVMDEFDLHYEICDKSQVSYFKDISWIEGIIKVGEGVIHTHDLRRDLVGSTKANVFVNSIVENIDANSGEIIVDGRVKGPYDYVINSTYIAPNMGLPDEMHYRLKYELTAMVLLKAPFGKDVALTIMDGDFVSLYPCDANMATLSSVPYTPFFRCDSMEELLANMNNAEGIARKKETSAKILQHGRELLDLDNIELEVKGLWIAPKTKIRDDIGNTRISSMKTYRRLISILCGKLDAARSISEQVSAFIK